MPLRSLVNCHRNLLGGGPLGVVTMNVVLSLEPSPSMGEGLGGGEVAQRLSDRLMDAVDICQDFAIPNPKNAISLVVQNPTSLGLWGRSIWQPRLSASVMFCRKVRARAWAPS